ncbi:hypothetical protein [Roseibium litorale]|uniref:Uncharacterized protein n=1 Tax=Roseibium litorale TaxID=2803841 RepID=A0ABR9CP35_9HYPH|nr:hypothetical protein [Roseibium litorale]MBD8892379.1 hypothetical protein [Roseibium litorale]
MSVAGIGLGSSVSGYSVQKSLGSEAASAAESSFSGGEENTGTQASQVRNADAPVTISYSKHLSVDVLTVLQKEQETETGAVASSEGSDQASESPVQRETVNGLEVIVSGHSIDAREGISLLRTVGGQLSYSPELLAQIEADKDNPQQHFTLNVNAPIEALPPGATGSYMPISIFKLEGQWNRGNPIELSTEMADQYNREDTEAFLERLEAERQLKDKYGEEIKLVYSHADNGYIMLTPDDLHYDEIPSVQEQMDGMLSEIRQGYNYSEATLSVLREHHYNV